MLRSAWRSSTAFWRAFRASISAFRVATSAICASRRLISLARNWLRSSWVLICVLDDGVPDARRWPAPTTAAMPMPAKNACLALLAPRFAVRQQVDQNHCTNLRIASPQAVRYDGASRRSLPSRTALPNFMFSNGLTTIGTRSR